jgi:predicted dehydrogenase
MSDINLQLPPIRVAIIGSGIFVRDTYIPNILAHHQRIKLTAILSRTMESIESTLQLLSSNKHKDNNNINNNHNNGSNNNDNVYQNLDNDIIKYAGSNGEETFFTEACNICDAVIIVVPIPLLSKYIERCLLLKLHILSEKPIAMTSIEAKRLIILYKHINNNNNSQSSLWHVAENYRMEPAVQYAAQLVKTYHLQPKTFTLIAIRQQTTSSKYAVTSWRSNPDYNGSFVFDGGIHFIALLRYILPGEVNVLNSIYEEKSVVEVGSCGVCKIGEAIGTYHIRYGAFPTVVCRLDVYWDDAVMSIIQHKGIGYEVMMTGMETKHFGFEGLELEFIAWLNSINTDGKKGSSSSYSSCSSSSITIITPVPELTPEEALNDLIVIEKMCLSQSSIN